MANQDHEHDTTTNDNTVYRELCDTLIPQMAFFHLSYGPSLF